MIGWCRVALGWAMAASFAALASAQMLNLPGSDRGPIEVNARDSIEWHRDQQRYVARGEARVSQGDFSVQADQLTAHYRQGQGGSTEIFRYEAEGRVRLATAVQRAVGDKAVYDIDNAVVVLTGRTLRMTTPNEDLTARDSLEYWEARRLAVARGNAQVVAAGGRRINADILTAYFSEATAPAPARPAPVRGAASPAPDPSSQRVERVEAFGNVHISTPTEIIRGERGVYNTLTGIAVLSGAVRITRGRSQLNGDSVEVNMNTGVSRLLSRRDPGADGRVRGLLIPQDRPPAPARP
jgi:lipopolysaccharide export system protein LptA